MSLRLHGDGRETTWNESELENLAKQFLDDGVLEDWEYDFLKQERLRLGLRESRFGVPCGATLQRILIPSGVCCLFGSSVGIRRGFTAIHFVTPVVFDCLHMIRLDLAQVIRSVSSNDYACVDSV